MLSNGTILIIISISVLISVFLVISIPKYLHLIEYANNTTVLNKIEKHICIFSTLCLIFGLCNFIMEYY